MRNIVTKSAVLAVILALFCGFAQAKVYKWVDENGVTQYTQYPPPKGSSTEVNVPGAPSAATPADGNSKEMQDRLEAFNKANEQQQRAAEETDEQRVDRETLAADCARLREDLQILSNNPRIRVHGADGVPVRMTENERQLRINSTRQQIEDHCSDV